jgi:hypothetical protein
VDRRPTREWQTFRIESIGDLFGAAFALYRQNALLFAGILLLIYVPTHLVYGFSLSFPPGSRTPSERLVALTALLPLQVAQAAMISALIERVLERPTGLVSTYRHLLRRLIPLLLTLLLAGGLVLLGLVLLIIPGVIALFWTFLVPYVVMVENGFYRQAIARSRELAQGQWGRILIVGALGALLPFLTDQPTLWLAGRLSDSLGQAKLWRGLLLSLVWGAVHPFLVILGGLIYLDARARKDKLDPVRLARDFH